MSKFYRDFSLWWLLYLLFNFVWWHCFRFVLSVIIHCHRSYLIDDLYVTTPSPWWHHLSIPLTTLAKLSLISQPIAQYPHLHWYIFIKLSPWSFLFFLPSSLFFLLSLPPLFFSFSFYISSNSFRVSFLGIHAFTS